MSLPDFIQGYLYFKNSLDQQKKRHYQELAQKGQNPNLMVIACCDSRISPEIILNSQPGEMFVVRNIANLVPPFAPDSALHSTSSALEYAVNNLQIKHILILGHEDCGGIKTALNAQNMQNDKTDFINKWLSLLDKTAQEINKDNNLNLTQKTIKLEQASLMLSIKNLRSFPWIKEKEDKKLLSLNAAWFSIEHGELWMLNEKANRFDKIT